MLPRSLTKLLIIIISTTWSLCYSLNSSQNEPVHKNCIGCALQRNELQSIGGVIAATEYFEARQDTNPPPLVYPIPGFIIISSKRHIQSMDEFTPAERQDFADFLYTIRKLMKEVLNIKTVYLIQEEDSSHFHIWLFPRYDWMLPLGKKIKSVIPIMKWAQENMNTEENLQKVLAAAEKLKQSYKEQAY